jgi:hypothetical protein
MSQLAPVSIGRRTFLGGCGDVPDRPKDWFLVVESKWVGEGAREGSALASGIFQMTLNDTSDAPDRRYSAHVVPMPREQLTIEEYFPRAPKSPVAPVAASCVALLGLNKRFS